MSIFRSGNNDYFTQNKTKLVNSQTETPGTVYISAMRQSDFDCRFVFGHNARETKA